MRDERVISDEPETLLEACLEGATDAVILMTILLIIFLPWYGIYRAVSWLF